MRQLVLVADRDARTGTTPSYCVFLEADVAKCYITLRRP